MQSISLFYVLIIIWHSIAWGFYKMNIWKLSFETSFDFKEILTNLQTFCSKFSKLYFLNRFLWVWYFINFIKILAIEYIIIRYIIEIASIIELLLEMYDLGSNVRTKQTICLIKRHQSWKNNNKFVYESIKKASKTCFAQI